MVKKITYIVSALLLLDIASCFADASNRVVLDHFFSDDSEGAEYKKYLAGYDRLFDKGQYVGFRAGVRNYHEDTMVDEKDFDEFRLQGRKNFGDAFYAEAGMSWLSGDDRDPFLYNLNLVYTPDEQWRIETYVEKELIDSIAAINNFNSYVVGGIVVDYHFLEEFTAVAGITRQHFKDSNNKNGWLAMLLYSPLQVENLTFKLEARQASSDFQSPDYFSPEEREQYYALVRYGIGLGENKPWWLRLEAGPGLQYIDNVREAAYKYRLDLEGPITDSFSLDLYYGCVGDRGEDDYKYCYGDVALYYLW